jgi:hypothetical protein
MDTGISTQLMISLAANEASAAQFEFIEPEHMLCGLLKLAELKQKDLELSLTDLALLPTLVEEQGELQRLFLELGITIPSDTKKKRDQIRKQMGKGGFIDAGNKALHRSKLSKDICIRAVQIAEKTGALAWKAVHVAAALQEKGIGDYSDSTPHNKETPKEAKETPLLDHYGTIYSFDKKEKLQETTKDPVVKVIWEMIEANRKASIVLIQEAGRPAEDILAETAKMFDRPTNSMQFVKVALQRIIDSAGDTVKLFSDLLLEASDAEMILCLENIDELLEHEEKTGQLLAEILLEHKIGCILITDPIVYEQIFGTRQPWKKLLWPIWIHNLAHISKS